MDVHQQWHQQAAPDRLPKHHVAEPYDARAVEGQSQCGLAVIGRHAWRDLDMIDPVLLAERPSAGSGLHDDANMVRQVCWSAWHAVAGEVGGCGADHALKFTNLSGSECHVGDATVSDRHVSMFLDQVDDAVGDRQVHLNIRIAGEEVRERRSELVYGKGDAGVDVEAATWRSARTRGLHLGFLDV